MDILMAMRTRVDRLAAWDELDAEAARLPALAVRLSDQSVLDALAEVTALANDAVRLQTILAGVAAQRSRRDGDRGGLAAVHGHASPASLIQSITGGTKADATRQVRVGVSLLEGVETGMPAAPADATAEATPTPWHEPVRRALLDGTLTAAQHDVIRVGLGEPSVMSAPAATGSDSGAAETRWRWGGNTGSTRRDRPSPSPPETAAAGGPAAPVPAWDPPPPPSRQNWRAA